MKKIIGLMLCLLVICSAQLALAEENYYNINIESCNEITVSYYNGGEFADPLMSGYYKYVTTDVTEIENILNSLSNMKLIPLSDNWGASGGESLTIDADGEMVISFLLSSTEKSLCRTSDKSYYFSSEEFRKLEDIVLSCKTKNDTKIYLNNEEIKFYNSPVITNGRTLVPAKVICDALGAEVGLGGDCVILKKEDKLLVICNDCVYENKKFIPIDVGYQVVDKIAKLPVRIVAEFFGYDVKWEKNSVYISSK